jgi:hypothetical protein
MTLIRVKASEYQGMMIYKSDSPFTDMLCEIAMKKNMSVTLRMIRCLQKYGYEVEGLYEEHSKPKK